MRLIAKYVNGNYSVAIFDDGTKIRYNELDSLEAEFPESFDLKITNRCHNACKFCHENSKCDGAHADILSKSFIDNLHPYTEIAIGGGNPLEHPDLVSFLEKLQKLKMIPSMTIRQNDFMENLPLLRNLRDRKLIYGLGVSLVNAKQNNFISALKEFPNAVVHVINGIVTVEDLMALSKNDIKILILGYKEVRRGKDLFSDPMEKDKINFLKDELYQFLPSVVLNDQFKVVSFDNLAIKQLNPQRLMSKEKWDEMYMGDDGIDGQTTSASMFIDMVEHTFSKNSCDMNRYPITDNIVEMFKIIKNQIGV